MSSTSTTTPRRPTSTRSWPSSPTPACWPPPDGWGGPTPAPLHGVDLAAGWPTGIAVDEGDGCGRAAPGDGSSVAVALDDALRRALLRQPCGVAFSGGRDSSVLLAAAVSLARREGLPEPVAVTNVVPGDGAAGDRRWQEALVRGLGVDWCRLPVDDELDLLGPVAAPVLARHGVVWPPAAVTQRRLHAVVPGGALVTGEHGDELLGDHRITPVIGTLRRRPRPSRRLVGAVALAVAPRAVRELALRRSMRRPAWLRPDAGAAFVAALAADRAAAPLRWRRALARDASTRAFRLGHRTLHALAGDADVLLVQPFAEPAVRRAVATAGGRVGWTSRTEAMVALFSGLVPDDLLRRRDKAYFNSVAFGPHARGFAARWDGTGLPADVDGLVDVDALAAAWRSAVPPAGTAGLLQAAWLGSRR